MAWGDKKREARRNTVESGGALSDRQAKKAGREHDAGRLGEDGRVRDTKGKVIGDFSKRTRRPGNVHGV